MPFTSGAIIGMVVVVILLFCSAMISGSEVAYFSLSPNHIHELKEQSTRKEKMVLALLDKPERLLANILITNNFINVGIVIIATFVTGSIFDFSGSPVPGFVTKDNRPLMSFGVMGGNMQPQGHVQLMVRIFDYGQNPQSACDAPRWYVDENFQIALEPGFSPVVVDELKQRGHVVVENAATSLFGGAQVIYRLENGYCAASDPRKDGQAVGY